MLNVGKEPKPCCLEQSQVRDLKSGLGWCIIAKRIENSAMSGWNYLLTVELRRRVHAGLNKGEARNALARAVFF